MNFERFAITSNHQNKSFNQDVSKVARRRGILKMWQKEF